MSFSLSLDALAVMLSLNDLMKFQCSRGSPSKIVSSFFGNERPCFMVNAILSITTSGQTDSVPFKLDPTGKPLNYRPLGRDWTS